MRKQSKGENKRRKADRKIRSKCSSDALNKKIAIWVRSNTIRHSRFKFQLRRTTLLQLLRANSQYSIRPLIYVFHWRSLKDIFWRLFFVFFENCTMVFAYLRMDNSISAICSTEKYPLLRSIIDCILKDPGSYSLIARYSVVIAAN